LLAVSDQGQSLVRDYIAGARVGKRRGANQIYPHKYLYQLHTNPLGDLLQDARKSSLGVSENRLASIQELRRQKYLDGISANTPH
jgi:hypothetical protein